MKKTHVPSVFSTLSDLINRERLFDSDLFTTGWSPLPAVNIKETEKSYEIEVAAPGLEKQDFDVQLENGVLTVKVEKENKKEETDNGYRRQEFSYQSFHRSVRLPEDVQEDQVKAAYENGVLKVSVDRKEAAAPKASKKISVA